MHCHESWFWIFPLVPFGMMILFFFVFSRRGWRGWCFTSAQERSSAKRIRNLEEEIERLKHRLPIETEDKGRSCS